ncbi:MAG: alanyl-tRNA editing protein [Clostridia bacterium]|nr:alanyl-tRNA editing protein [Clostridia bacterium]
MYYTEKIYDKNPHCHTFSATVLATIDTPKGYAVYLDRTAFFYEGGGQSADSGTLGGIEVLDVRDGKEGIYHLLSAPLPEGKIVEGKIDSSKRFRHMQAHSAEHILSGLAYSLFGAENVGFHLGKTEVTCDYDKPFSYEQIRLLEQKTNQAIWANLPITVTYPTPQELKEMTYRSKLDLKENVRIVTVEGIDVCACCAPHVSYTGEIGVFAISTFMHYKGGTRCTIKAGVDGLAFLGQMQSQLEEISHLLSAPLDQCAEAVNRLNDTANDLRYTMVGLRRALMDVRIANATPKDGCLFFFDDDATAEDMRYLTATGVGKCELACGSFVQNDGEGWRFLLVSSTCDLSMIQPTLRGEYHAKCGGSRSMLSGILPKNKDDIMRFLPALLKSCPSANG